MSMRALHYACAIIYGGGPNCRRIWTEQDIPGSIDALLAAGADPDARDEYGNTPLLYALCGEGASLESGSFAVQYL